MANPKERLHEEIPPRRILREIYRHYTEFKEYVGSTGKHVIEHGYYLYEEDNTTIKDKILITISFWDLQNGLSKLSKRKREALYYNVILDKKQKEVVEIMGITTVSVGQYVEQACEQLAQEYFSELFEKEEPNVLEKQ